MILRDHLPCLRHRIRAYRTVAPVAALNLPSPTCVTKSQNICTQLWSRNGHRRLTPPIFTSGHFVPTTAFKLDLSLTLYAMNINSYRKLKYVGWKVFNRDVAATEMTCPHSARKRMTSSNKYTSVPHLDLGFVDGKLVHSEHHHVPSLISKTVYLPHTAVCTPTYLPIIWKMTMI